MTQNKKPKRILVSNDDGIHAPGLEVAIEIARTFTDDVWVVAPETEQSGASHSLTLTLPLRIRQVDERRFAVQGTPTDSVMMAIIHLMKDQPPDLVLSGVNRGFNVADDITYSGTVAAAMEGTVLGYPAIALSQSFTRHEDAEVYWNCSRTHGPPVVARLIKIGWPKGVLMNVNFPDVPADAVQGVAVTTQGARDQSLLRVDERRDARGRPYFWVGFKRVLSEPQEGSDLRALAEGLVSVTPLHLNLTEWRERERLAPLLDDLAVGQS